VVIHYKKAGELLDEETAMERSENKVCIFTSRAKQLDYDTVEKV
jgi:hypothetical protein